MRRSIDRWRDCDPQAMAQQSEAAVRYAFDDAKADILTLHAALSEIALAGMSAPPQMHPDEVTAWHASRAMEFICIAARALKPNTRNQRPAQRVRWHEQQGYGGTMDAIEQRNALMERCRKQRAEIRQFFVDANHWNATHPAAERIDPDPDGQLSRLADGLDRALAKTANP